MKTDKSIVDILQALDRSKIHIPKDHGVLLAQDEDVMMQVMELGYDLKPLGMHLGISIGTVSFVRAS